MRKSFFLLLAGFALSGCVLLAPYTITFTNDIGEVIDPATSTLNFVVSQPTLAYIAGFSCEGAEPVEFLPVVKDDMEVSTLHKLPLSMLAGQAPGVACDITVTVFDRTTTAQASSTISLTMPGTKVIEEDVVEENVISDEFDPTDEAVDEVTTPAEDGTLDETTVDDTEVDPTPTDVTTDGTTGEVVDGTVPTDTTDTSAQQ